MIEGRKQPEAGRLPTPFFVNWRMKCLLSLFILGWNGVAAQHVGWSNDDMVQLRVWLRASNQDGSLVRLYAAQRALADQALTEDPHPIDTIRSEGLLQGDPKKTATQAALKDMTKMYALALLYKISGDRIYLEQLESYLTAWASTDHPRGDPIDDTNLDPVIEAYDMVKSDVTAGTARAVRNSAAAGNRAQARNGGRLLFLGFFNGQLDPKIGGMGRALRNGRQDTCGVCKQHGGVRPAAGGQWGGAV